MLLESLLSNRIVWNLSECFDSRGCSDSKDSKDTAAMPIRMPPTTAAITPMTTAITATTITIVRFFIDSTSVRYGYFFLYFTILRGLRQ